MQMQIGWLNFRPFLVTLQEEPEKTARIMAHFKDVGLEPEVFNGIHAVQSGLYTKHTYDIDKPGSGWRIPEVNVANWLSFYMLWAALNMQPDSHFLTLEWDAKFDPKWKDRLQAVLQHLPKDFDMLFLGSCCTWDKVRTQIHGSELWEVKWPMCGHATIVAKKALPVLLATQRKCYAPMDISIMFHTLPLLKVYTILPRMVDQFNTKLVE